MPWTFHVAFFFGNKREEKEKKGRKRKTFHVAS